MRRRINFITQDKLANFKFAFIIPPHDISKTRSSQLNKLQQFELVAPEAIELPIWSDAENGAQAAVANIKLHHPYSLFLITSCPKRAAIGVFTVCIRIN